MKPDDMYSALISLEEMRDDAFVFLARFGQELGAGVLAAGLLIMLLLSTTGCATCEPEIITRVETIEVPVPTVGEALPVCRAELEACSQVLAPDLVRCIGRNIAALVECAEKNAATIETHNEGIEAH